jgi:hypothetical protein
MNGSPESSDCLLAGSEGAGSRNDRWSAGACASPSNNFQVVSLPTF